MNERKLKKIDSLFTSSEQNVSSAAPTSGQIQMISHLLIDPHPHHSFKPFDATRHLGLMESVQELGVLQPVLLQPKPDGRFTLLAGYKRLHCNIQAGREAVPAIIRDDVPDAVASLMISQTNTTQCGLQGMLTSELAYALKLELDSYTELRKQLRLKGIKNGQIEINGKMYKFVHLESSRDSLAKSYGMQPIDVQRLVQMTNLIPGLFDLVDRKKLAVSAGVPLAALPADYQEKVLSLIQTGISMNASKANLLKKKYTKGALEVDNIANVISEPRIAPRATTIKLQPSLLKKYFANDESAEKIQDTIAAALEAYFTARANAENKGGMAK